MDADPKTIKLLRQVLAFHGKDLLYALENPENDPTTVVQHMSYRAVGSIPEDEVDAIANQRNSQWLREGGEYRRIENAKHSRKQVEERLVGATPTE